MFKGKYSHYLKSIGPGILFASSAIGVSHLVQSTRAGADFGFIMIIFILLANLFKYPFFEFGPRYAVTTGKSLLEGYKNQGKWVLYVYFLISFITMFTITAAVSFVTVGLLANIFGIKSDIILLTAILFVICSAMLILGRYAFLDFLIKIVGFILVLSTIVAFVLIIIHGSENDVMRLPSKSLFDFGSIAFIIALMGWMPSTIDVAAWNSLWTLERIKQTGYHPKLKETLFDFNLGYIISAILAFLFLTLGVMIMFGTEMKFSEGSVAFTNQVINLYTSILGDWSYFIIAISAFTTMFSTTIIVIDGFARVMENSTNLIFPESKRINSKYLFSGWVIITSFGGFSLITFYLHSLTQLVDLATTISFLLAPFFAILNLKVILSNDIPEENKPKLWIRILSFLGIIFLSSFALLFIYQKIIS